MPIEGFIQYGLWFQKKAVPDLDRRAIELIETDTNGFRLVTNDGEVVKAKKVVIATGIAPFAWMPPEFRQSPRAFVSHASEHKDFRTFARKQVIVVGGGQSALESAALLHESGAQVEVVTRAARIHWLQGSLSKALHHRMGKLTSQLLYAPTDVGPAGLSQLMARPDLLRRLPRGLQNRLRARAVRPAGARWLVKRLQSTPIRFETSLESITEAGDRISCRLSDGTDRAVDHVLCGTGYKVDIANYRFLSRALLKSIACRNGYPELQRGLETSVPGLHILGAPAAWSFGPLMQFVSGTHYAGRSLARSIAR